MQCDNGPMHDEPPQVGELFRNTAMRGLLQCEERLLTEQVGRIPACPALSLACVGMPPPPKTGHDWLHLAIDRRDCACGSVVARSSALPLLDASMGMVLMRHAMQLTQSPVGLIAEAKRVLMPGGVLLITGVHPCSLWHPWLLQLSRTQRYRFQTQSPFHWRFRLLGTAFDVENVVRFGAVLPGESRRHPTQAGPLAAAFLLLARKRPGASIPAIRKSTRLVHNNTVGVLAGARRLAG